MVGYRAGFECKKSHTPLGACDSVLSLGIKKAINVSATMKDTALDETVESSVAIN